MCLHFSIHKVIIHNDTNTDITYTPVGHITDITYITDITLLHLNDLHDKYLLITSLYVNEENVVN